MFDILCRKSPDATEEFQRLPLFYRLFPLFCEFYSLRTVTHIRLKQILQLSTSIERAVMQFSKI